MRSAPAFDSQLDATADVAPPKGMINNVSVEGFQCSVEVSMVRKVTQAALAATIKIAIPVCKGGVSG